MKSFLFLLLLLSTLPLAAQRNAEWKRSNDRGTRYEGTYSRQVSGGLELVSLHAGMPASFSFGQGQQLRVRMYSPGNLSYTLHAEDLSGTQFYWWEDKNGQTSTGWYHSPAEWSVDYLLARLRLPANNLGICAETQGSTRDHKKYLVAQVYTGGTPPPVERFTAVLRLGRATAGGTYKVYRGESRSGSPLLEGNITARSGGSRVNLSFPASSLQAAGWYFVDITLRERGTLNPSTHTFSFYVPPRS